MPCSSTTIAHLLLGEVTHGRYRSVNLHTELVGQLRLLAIMPLAWVFASYTCPRAGTAGMHCRWTGTPAWLLLPSVSRIESIDAQLAGRCCYDLRSSAYIFSLSWPVRWIERANTPLRLTIRRRRVLTQLPAISGRDSSCSFTHCIRLLITHYLPVISLAVGSLPKLEVIPLPGHNALLLPP